jgi:hypothetical protein
LYLITIRLSACIGVDELIEAPASIIDTDTISLNMINVHVAVIENARRLGDDGKTTHDERFKI